MTGYDPEAHLAGLGVPIDEVQLEDGLRGLTYMRDGRAVRVEVDVRELQAGRRATLAHEAVHVERGPFPAWAEAQEERAVEWTAAARLIDVEELLDAARWSDSIEEMAEALNVDYAMVATRLRMLTKAEARRFYQALPDGIRTMKSGPLRRRRGSHKPDNAGAR